MSVANNLDQKQTWKDISDQCIQKFTRSNVIYVQKVLDRNMFWKNIIQQLTKTRSKLILFFLAFQLTTLLSRSFINSFSKIVKFHEINFLEIKKTFGNSAFFLKTCLSSFIDISKCKQNKSQFLPSQILKTKQSKWLEFHVIFVEMLLDRISL